MSKLTFVELMTDQSSLLMIKRIMQFARPYLRKMILGLLCMLVVAATTAACAELMKPIINDIFIGKRVDLLWPITGAVFLIFFLKGIFTYGESVLMAYVGNRIICDFQQTLFNRLISSDLRFFHGVPTGDLVSRFMNDVNKLNSAVTGTFSNIGKDALTLIFFLLVMFREDWQLAGVVFVVLPVAIFPVIRIGRRMRKASILIQEQTADLTILLTQAFQGIRLVKSYCMEKYEQSRLSVSIQNVFKRTIKGAKVKSATHPIMEFLGGIAIAAVIVYGGSQVIAGTQTPGAFFAFITALIMSYEPLKRLANLNANLQEQLAAAGRVFELLDYKNHIEDLPEASYIKILKGHIHFHNVCFSYSPDQPILKNVTLDIPSGQTVALVGPSGGGKSTLMNLIPRFFEVVEGEICIDDHALQNFTLQSLRQQIALVSQEVILFDDTIYGNILYGNPQANEDEVKAAAKAAGAHEFIMALPQGYSTYVGEQGLRLSGGQRQRLAIARAILKNAPILLMDEPTSALDSESEQIIQEALRNLMHNKTTLIIAHRLATVRNADIIYVIEDGMVTAKGTHDVLLNTSPKYAQLCKIQFEQTEKSCVGTNDF